MDESMFASDGIIITKVTITKLTINAVIVNLLVLAWQACVMRRLRGTCLI